MTKVRSQALPKKRIQRRRYVKTRREDDVMWKIVHTHDAATGNDRSPTVVRRVRRMTSIDDDAERSLHWAWESAWRLSSSVRYGGDRGHIWTQISYCEFEINPFLCLQPVRLTEDRSDVNTLISTTCKLVEQLHSSLTEAAEVDVEEFRPVSRYSYPDDWGQSDVTSDWTTSLDTERRMERSCLSTDVDVGTHRHVWVENNS